MKRLIMIVSLSACTRTTDLVPAQRDAAPVSDGELPAPAIVLCGATPCTCANGLDDDADGLIDGADPECTSATDAFEDSFATGVHGEDQKSKCQDCFWDDNSGTGDDRCNRARSCATDGEPSGGTGACRACAVEAACAQSCLPRVPNGCDCFGCCEVWRDGALLAHVMLEASCSLAALDDPDKCARCTPAADCRNPCGTCELCAGRSRADLPATCAAATCEGQTACVTSADCEGLAYCQQGCCLQQGI